MPDDNNKPVVDNYGDPPEVYENEIEFYLKEYININNIENMKTESQNVWNQALLYIYRHVFKNNKDKLLTPDRISNSYNIDLILAICDIYIYLCYGYDKEISIKGFSHLTGITRETIDSWGNKDTRASTKASDIYKKLNEENEESLSGLLISGKRPPVAILGALNKRHSWNIPQPMEEGQMQKRISTDEILILRQIRQRDPESEPQKPDDI